TVHVVFHRKDARIVTEAKLCENIQRPGGAPRDGKAGRSITVDRLAGGLFDTILGEQRIFAKFIRRKFVNQAMPIGMTRGLVAAPGDLRYETWITLRTPAENEERARDVTFVEKVQDPPRVLLDAAGVSPPSGTIDDAGESFYVIVVFDVNGNDAAAV